MPLFFIFKIERIMAKDKQLPDQPQTMEDYLLSQLEEQVVLN